jgi:hypothetical protein
MHYLFACSVHWTYGMVWYSGTGWEGVDSISAAQYDETGLLSQDTLQSSIGTAIICHTCILVGVIERF